MLLEALPPQPLFGEVLVYFPDPWRGSLERRVLRPEVTHAIWQRCLPGARLRLATDVADYPEHARNVLGTEAGGCWHELPCSRRGEQEAGASARPSTKYEREAIHAKRAVTDMVFEAVSAPAGDSQCKGRN